MKYKIFSINSINENDLVVLPQIADNCYWCTPFQTIEWFKKTNNIEGYLSFILVIYDDNIIVGYLPFYFHHNYFGYSISIGESKIETVYGGFVLKNEYISFLDQKLLSEIIATIKYYFGPFLIQIKIELAPHHPPLLYPQFKVILFYETPIIDLFPEINEIFKKIDKKSAQYVINKIDKQLSNLIITENNYSSISELYSNLKNIFERGNNKISKLQLYEKLLYENGNHYSQEYKTCFLTARTKENEYLGSVVCLLKNRIAYYLIASNSSLGYKYSINDYLLWSSIRWAKNAGAIKFDLLRIPIRIKAITNNLLGVSKFKLKYTKQSLPLYYYTYYNFYFYINKIITKIIKISNIK